MNELDLIYLKDLAFEYLSKDAQDMIQANLKIRHKVGAEARMAFIRWERAGLHLKATEVAANDLLLLVATHPAFIEDGAIDGSSEIANEQREKEIIDAAFVLSDVAGITLPDWLVRNPSVEAQALQQELEALKAEVERLQSENDRLKIDDEINPRKEETLYRLIIGMAQAGYLYDPNATKNSAVADIHKDLDRLGIGLGERTIRNHLNAAKDYLPPKPIKP